MKKALIPIVLLALLLTMGFLLVEQNEKLDTNQSIAQLLEGLGEKAPEHKIVADSQKIRMGKEMVKLGRTTLPNGKKSKFISKYFVCTSCHNLEREDEVLNAYDPEARLKYVSKHNLPFLQATTFWGIVNRESWYNDDYYKKYGENVRKANNDLGEAIQLCAIECSQGRPLEPWEEEAIVQYYWTLELKISDLTLSNQEETQLAKALKTGLDQEAAVKLLKGKYATKSPAHFDYPPDNKFNGYRNVGIAENGKLIYEKSCMHCHLHQGVSDFVLDDSKYSFAFLKKYMTENNQLSFYEVIRRGTYSRVGSMPYMPHYPLEKMSNQQVEDLRQYIIERAN